MSPKWAFLAHFGDISYNVFNRRISLLLKLGTWFPPMWRHQGPRHSRPWQRRVCWNTAGCNAMSWPQSGTPHWLVCNAKHTGIKYELDKNKSHSDSGQFNLAPYEHKLHTEETSKYCKLMKCAIRQLRGSRFQYYTLNLFFPLWTMLHFGNFVCTFTISPQVRLL